MTFVGSISPYYTMQRGTASRVPICTLRKCDAVSAGMMSNLGITMVCLVLQHFTTERSITLLWSEIFHLHWWIWLDRILSIKLYSKYVLVSEALGQWSVRFKFHPTVTIDTRPSNRLATICEMTFATIWFNFAYNSWHHWQTTLQIAFAA